MGPKKNKSESCQVKRKTVRTTIELKKEIIGKYENGVRVLDTAVEYSMTKSSLSNSVSPIACCKAVNKW